ncbi:Fe-S cluster assembly ATPase SufC [Thermoplasmatales archaeon SW_10_69_26]|nr:MAG: Fe-S cluster assembly ATPase SufC [Thermoplasmatales archaeon SW_10_69_26]
MLEIDNLHVSADDTGILRGIDLDVDGGELHAIMGPNGSGKSTLAKALAGHEAYEIDEGDVTYKGKDLLELEADDRAHEGVFLAFQYPVEIPGVTQMTFLRTALNSIREANGKDPMSAGEFLELAREKLDELDLPEDMLKRSLNEGFSGGEKKRNEIFQMAVLQPELCLLDETDSGLDIDALQIVADGINRMREDEDRSMVLITHYERILEYVEPDHVHVMLGGQIAKSGGPELAEKLEEKGYDWIEEETGIQRSPQQAEGALTS